MLVAPWRHERNGITYPAGTVFSYVGMRIWSWLTPAGDNGEVVIYLHEKIGGA